MKHRFAVVAAAGIFAITLGVLAGLVITISHRVRASSPAVSSTSAPARPGTSSSPSSPSPTSPSVALTVSGDDGQTTSSTQSSPPALTRAALTSPAVTTRTTPDTRVIRTTQVGVLATNRVSTSPTVSTSPKSTTTIRSSTSTAPTSTAHSTASSTTASTTSAATTGLPCQDFGSSTTIGRVTAYCQHDQTDGKLRWRLVVDGGGCLSRTMTGTGVDGRRYVCRATAGGLDHWVRGMNPGTLRRERTA